MTEIVKIALGIITCFIAGLTLVWDHPDEFQAVLDRVNTLTANPDPLTWWAFNICFASATQVGCSSYLLYRIRKLSRGSDQRAAIRGFFLSNVMYYIALPLLARPLGLGQVGQNAALEVLNLYLGFWLFELACAISPARLRSKYQRRASRAVAAMALGLAVLLVFAPGIAQDLGLCTDQVALRYLAAFGSTIFVALCGSTCLVAVWRGYCVKRAPGLAVVAVALYSTGLWSRVVFCMEPTLWAGLWGLTFFGAGMTGKFAIWSGARRARVTRSKSAAQTTPLADWLNSWFERSALLRRVVRPGKADERSKHELC